MTDHEASKVVVDIALNCSDPPELKVVEDNSTAATRRQQLDGRNSTAATRLPQLDGRNSTAATRRPQLDCRNSTAATRRPQLDGRNSTAATRRPQLDGRNSTAATPRPQLDGRNSADVQSVRIDRVKHRLLEKRPKQQSGEDRIPTSSLIFYEIKTII